jgi:threonyl-tRNA synthetase
MIHRAPFGSMERFVAVLLEHTAGNFPLWLTPEQAIILPISDKYIDYAYELKNELEEHNIRVHIDERSEKTGKKIRDAELKKIPYMLIVGEKEEAEKTISVREHKVGDIGAMTPHDFVVMINEKIKEELA